MTVKEYLAYFNADDNVLEHHGIKGMKWGVRKEQKRATRQAKKQRKLDARKAKILKSPSRLKKNLDKFSKTEIDQAVARMELNNKLRKLNNANIKSGSEFANAFLAVGTTAVAAYGIYNSPLGTAIRSAVQRKANIPLGSSGIHIVK